MLFLKIYYFKCKIWAYIFKKLEFLNFIHLTDILSFKIKLK